jgi:hypothetical protein
MNMNEPDIDARLDALLREPAPAADPAFADRVMLAIRVEQEFAATRRRAWRRALIDCGAAAAVGMTFFMMSQIGTPDPTGLIHLQGPAMGGLIMLLLWGVVALPTSGSRTGLGRVG